MIEIDGSILEGGGQSLRVSIALSAVTGTPIKVRNIRAKRSNPGLRAQHVKAVEAVARFVHAKTKGANMGSQEVEFIPGPLEGEDFKIDIGTAGSTSLILQALMPAMAFARGPTSVVIKGGTNNPMAPPVEFLERCFFPTVHKMGLSTSLELVKRGFYPKGQGILKVGTRPLKRLCPVTLTEYGHVSKISGLAYSSRLPQHITDRMISAAATLLREAGYSDLYIDRETLQANDPRCAVNPGCGLILIAELSSGGLISGDSLGELGKPAEKVGGEAASLLIEQLKKGMPADKHLADQLAIWMGLAEGTSKIETSELTLHTLTCIEVIQSLINAKFKVDGEQGKPATITCQGIGFQNKALRTT